MPQEPTQSAKARRERFLRVASHRTQKVLDDIRRLAKCANPAAYQYDAADVEKVFAAIEREINNARARFDAKDARKEARFSFD